MRKYDRLPPFAAQMVAVVCLAGLAFGAGCTTPYNPLRDFEPVSPAVELEVPLASASRSATYPAEQVGRGKYLVKLLGCGICHTDGALIGDPNYSLNLAGSRIGIAYTNPMIDKYPGVTYPSNITPDVETGIGSWSESEIVRLLRSGEASHDLLNPGRHLVSSGHYRNLREGAFSEWSKAACESHRQPRGSNHLRRIISFSLIV